MGRIGGEGEEHMHGSSVLETEDISRISQTVLM